MSNLENREIIDILFSHMNEGIIVADSAGIVQLVNPAGCKMLGYTESELLGDTIDKLVPEAVQHKHAEHRKHFANHAHARPMGVGLDLFARRKDGSQVPVEISLSPLQVNGEKLYIAFLIDITIRKEIEKVIQEKQKELERVAAALIATNEELEKKVGDRTKVLQEAIRELEKSRNELSKALEKEKDLNDLKSRFISMASHEFRTPLTTILSSASLIQEYNEGVAAEKREKHINRIKSAVNNLNDILSDFLSISKLEEGKVHADYRHFNLQENIQEVVEDLKLNLKSGQQLKYEHKGENLIHLDPKLLKNILINLVSNAVKFSRENKTIKVRSRVDDYTISVEVADQGIGISEEDQKHLFERFYRGKNAFNIQGTGLGLHIVGSYVDLMKGHIILHSELEKGTTIKITFPNQN